MIAAAVIGAVVGIPSLRIKDDYFVIATFAFQIITFSILNNLVDFTGGPLGLPGIPQPAIFGLYYFYSCSIFNFIFAISLVHLFYLQSVNQISLRKSS